LGVFFEEDIGFQKGFFKMRLPLVFQFFGFWLCLALPCAVASPLGQYIWGPPDSDPVRPYLETAKIPHNSQWEEKGWTPQDWIDSRDGNAFTVVNGLYEAKIITDQYSDGDVPVLEVGQAFLDLSHQDKRRVTAFFDAVFGITKTGKGFFLIRFHKHSIPVGLFNAKGLQLQ